MLKSLPGILIFVSGLVWAAASDAHGINESYVFLDVGTGSLGGRYEVRLQDLAGVGDLDADGDGVLSRVEADAAHEEIYEFLAPRVGFDIGGQTMGVTMRDHSYFDATEATFMAVRFETVWDRQVPETISMRFYPFATEMPNVERGLVVVESNALTGLRDNESVVAQVFGPGSGWKSIGLQRDGVGQRFVMFLRNGMHHILKGYDHAALVIALVLASVLIRSGQGPARPVETLGPGLSTALGLVTAFVIAQAVTMGIAALGLVPYWSGLVEFLLAATVLAVAWHNIMGRRDRLLYAIIIGMGLLHGLGYGKILGHYGSYQSEVWLSILAFNLGVEMGQVAIVLLLFPVLFVIRNWAGYNRVINMGGSALLGLVALYWMAIRMPAIFASWG